MDEISLYLNITRLFVGCLILLYASYTDIKTRKASDILWIIIGIIGGFLLIIDISFIGIENVIDVFSDFGTIWTKIFYVSYMGFNYAFYMDNSI